MFVWTENLIPQQVSLDYVKAYRIQEDHWESYFGGNITLKVTSEAILL
jgi:hypothetical protein